MTDDAFLKAAADYTASRVEPLTPTEAARVPVGNGPSWQQVTGVVVACMIFLGVLAPVALLFYYRHLTRFYRSEAARVELRKLMQRAVFLGAVVMVPLWLIILLK